MVGRPDEPYFWHLFRVAASVSLADRVVALLHDVMEDAPGAGLPDLLRQDEIADLDTLTRRESETYADYIKRVKAGSARARRVKIADLKENIKNLPASDWRRHRRYTAALLELEPACDAVLYHGLGHQSRTLCQLRGDHEIHYTVYGRFDTEAYWRGESAMTGPFDAPPELEEDE